MARQIGPIKIVGTFDNVCFYRMEGKYYARLVHRHKSKKVKTSPRFALTMVYAGLLGRASKIASTVYKDLPKDFRQFWMYRAFTGEAMQLLKAGKNDEDAQKELWQTYASVHHMPVIAVRKKPVARKIKAGVKLLIRKRISRKGLLAANAERRIHDTKRLSFFATQRVPTDRQHSSNRKPPS